MHNANVMEVVLANTTENLMDNVITNVICKGMGLIMDKCHGK